MATPFGTVLAAAINEAGLSANRFAQLVGFGQPNLVKVLKGNRKPPLDLVDGWAEALHLRADERTQFIELAHLAHATPVVQALVNRLRAELAARPVRRPRQPRR